MHGSAGDRRALEREALRNVINQWNANRLDLFELSEPNEDLEFHGVMRFYFQDSGQKVATKCIRVASDATVEDVIGTLVEKFRPDMRMLSVPSYALYELHENCPERKMSPDEKPLLVQLNWHVDDREGRFLLKNVDDKTVNSVGLTDSNASFRRKLSRREKKQLKKQEKSLKLKSENGDVNEKDGVAEKLYTELPETIFTRSISNPEAVMRRRRQQKLEKKLQQFRSKDGGPDTGGTLKIYGEALCRDVPYKTLLLSVRDCAGAVVREMLDKYGLNKADPSQWCLVQVTQQPGANDVEYVLDDDECPLSILMNAPNTSSIMFHVRRRPADCAPRKRKKKPGTMGTNHTNSREARGEVVPLLIELGPDGSAPHPGDTARTIRLNSDVMEVGSANGIALQLYGPHIQPRHCVITNTDGVTSLTPCHADAHTYVNGQRIHQTTILQHGSLVKFGHSNTYRFLDPAYEDRTRNPALIDGTRTYDRSPRALSPVEPSRENFETTFDLEGNVETVSTASGAREDSRSLGSSSENRLSGIDRYPRGQDPILPAVLEFPEEPQEQFLARVITHLDVTTPTFRLAPAYTLYLCARYRASTHYRPELTPTERAHKLTVLLQHAAMLIRHTIQDRSTESTSQAFWLANASELLHFLKSDRHVSAFSIQAQETLADAVQLAFRNLIACLTDELNSVMGSLMSDTADDHPRDVINVLSAAMNLLRKCRVNAALTIQLFSQLFHWISSRALSTIINNPELCTRMFGIKLFNRLRNLQAWAESQGLELAAECHLAKIVQCAHLLQAPKYTAEELANLSAACFKLNSLQLRALLTQYKAEPGEQIASPSLLEQAARAAEGVADELARAEGREVRLHEDPAPALQLLLPDDGFSCDVVQGVPPGLADFLHPLQASGLCRLAAQPTSSGHWTVYMSVPRPPSALSTTQPEVLVIRLHKAGGGMGLSIVAAKGAGQERLGIYIKSVVPGGAADRDGRLSAGDQLLSVDGQSLLGITQEKAAEFLVRTGSVVTLEVAKGGAVYHGLATLLQQPSPTPHRAWDSLHFYKYQGSQDSLNSECGYFYTPPAPKPPKHVFFNSDDSLYKSEVRKLTIPRIEIEQCEPVFQLQVTDFSEPAPKDVTIDYDVNKSGSNKSAGFKQHKSQSLDVTDIPSIHIDLVGDCDTDGYNTAMNKLNKPVVYSSLQDLSSSTSSINSGIHESNLDLSSFDPDTPIKLRNWKSPDEIRKGYVKTLAKQFEESFASKAVISNSTSTPNLGEYSNKSTLNKKYLSENKLSEKLTDFERLEVLKLLRDWTLHGSEAKDVSLKITSLKLDSTSTKKHILNTSVKFASAPNLLPDSVCKTKNIRSPSLKKYKSDDCLDKNTLEPEFLHKCRFENCIFNTNFNTSGTKTQQPELKPKGILKSTQSKVNDSQLSREKKLLKDTHRRYSEIIDTSLIKNELKKCDSLERLTELKKKKFPDAYIVKKSYTKDVTRSANKTAKVVVIRKLCIPKSWRSCSDIKYQRQKVIRKCCRNARKSCPVYRNSSYGSPRKVKSCLEINNKNIDGSLAKTGPKRESGGVTEIVTGVNRFSPRRMSERDLPSRVDAERSIPSSKSVPALHHISPGSEQSRNPHELFNPGYSRTSSSNSINTNSANVGPTNGVVNQGNNLRSRSTHNLLQQDAGFYQNLSVYRNKMPSPQQLGDRSSVLRGSQNSLQSSVTNSQRPASAYYPPTSGAPVARPNLHQSIPNLKSSPSNHRLQTEDSRSGSFPAVNQHHAQNYYQGYPNNYPNQPHQATQGHYPRQHEELNSHQFYPAQKTDNNPYQNSSAYMSQNMQYNPGLSREDILRHSHGTERQEEMMRYPSTNNIKVSEPQIQQSIIQEDIARHDMRTSRSEDMLRQYTNNQSEMVRYASSGNVRGSEGGRFMPEDRNQVFREEARPVNNINMRGQAKLAEMSEEVRRRQHRGYPPNYPQNYYQQNQQQLAQSQPAYSNTHQSYPPHMNAQVAHNTQALQNLNLNSSYHQNAQYTVQNPPYQINMQSASFAKQPPVAPKPLKKLEEPPELPPTSTHPLYSASSQDPPKMAFYPTRGTVTKTARDPWAREEQEKKEEIRREQARQWQEQQIRELLSLPHRTPQQEEQLRVLQLEREFQRRAMEAAEQDDDDTEKESPSPVTSPPLMSPVDNSASTTLPPSMQQTKQEPPASILKPGAQPNNLAPPPEPVAPPPPERGSSYTVMSLRNRETTKRVSFNDASAAVTPVPNTLQLDDSNREDPNSFIRQAESMLASPTTPTDTIPGITTATPGVIGAQEVYRDPRARRLAEQAQQKPQTPVPEKLSFKEKMKMFAMETGEAGTPKDKSKISRAQREIDNINSANSNLVH